METTEFSLELYFPLPLLSSSKHLPCTSGKEPFLTVFKRETRKTTIPRITSASVQPLAVIVKRLLNIKHHPFGDCVFPFSCRDGYKENGHSADAVAHSLAVFLVAPWLRTTGLGVKVYQSESASSLVRQSLNPVAKRVGCKAQLFLLFK